MKPLHKKKLMSYKRRLTLRPLTTFIYLLWKSYTKWFFYRAMLCTARTMLPQDVPSVRSSVTSRYCRACQNGKTKILSPPVNPLF